MSFSVIVLAAGQGTRMRSSKPKVLQLLAGKPLLHHVLGTVQQLSPAQTMVVCGYKAEELQTSCKEFNVDWVWQAEQLGTGHAVQVAFPEMQMARRILVVYGDVPLIGAATLTALLEHTPYDSLGILTAELSNPYGLGRIIRNQTGDIVEIVEEKDASVEQRKIREINTGIYVLPYKYLATWLSNLKATNQQQEYYLTDLVSMAVHDQVQIVSLKIQDSLEIAGINSQSQLADVEREYQFRAVKTLMDRGVKIYDPARIDVRGTVAVGQDVVIDINVVFEGEVFLGDGVNVGPNVLIKNSIVGSGTTIYANSVIDSARIGASCQLGPFARVRPGTVLHDQSKVGNFVEIKNAVVGLKSKVNHLSYIGDAELGANVNIGAGVITCNYDGAFKHKTIIEDDAFIGSNSELIAPVRVGKGATLAAGTTLMKNAPAGALTLTKKILSNILNWQRPAKQKEEA